jgi:hypothetical protein
MPLNYPFYSICCVLFLVFVALFAMLCVLCNEFYELYSMRCIIFFVLSVLQYMHCIICTVLYAFALLIVLYTENLCTFVTGRGKEDKKGSLIELLS